MVGSEVSCGGIASDDPARAAGGAQTDGGSCRVFAELVDRYRFGNFGGGVDLGSDYGLHAMENGARLLEYDCESSLLSAHDCGHAFDWVSDTIFGAGRRDGLGLCSNRRVVSVLRHAARVAWRGADGI